MTMENNNLRLMVGNEFFSEEGNSGDWGDYIPDMIANLLSPPNYNFPKVITGYLYFNLTIETFGYGLWRGSELCTVPNYIMVFPSAYTLNNGNTYWGTDVQPNEATIKNSYIGFFGSSSKDILAEWGFYDNVYLNYLRDGILEWFKMMNDNSDWYNKLFNSPKTINVARMMEYGRQVANTILLMKPEDAINTAKQFLGDTYEYIKNNPIDALIFGVQLGIRDNLLGLAVSEGLTICYMAYKTGFLSKWDEWKKTNGDNLTSFAKFMTHYLNPFNPDGVVKDLEDATGREINDWKDLLTALWDVSKDFIINNTPLKDWLGNNSNKSWEDIYNELSKQAYNSIVKEDFHPVSFMVRDCSYSVASYDGWLFPKYHIYRAYDFQPPKYELRKLIFTGNDALITHIDFDVNNLFNRPTTDLLLIKNYDGEYGLLSELLDNFNGTLYICSPYPSYIQMQLYSIPKLKLE